jgi:hypothetical protein
MLKRTFRHPTPPAMTLSLAELHVGPPSPRDTRPSVPEDRAHAESDVPCMTEGSSVGSVGEATSSSPLGARERRSPSRTGARAALRRPEAARLAGPRDRVDAPSCRPTLTSGPDLDHPLGL